MWMTVEIMLLTFNSISIACREIDVGPQLHRSTISLVCLWGKPLAVGQCDGVFMGETSCGLTIYIRRKQNDCYAAFENPLSKMMNYFQFENYWSPLFTSLFRHSWYKHQGRPYSALIHYRLQVKKIYIHLNVFFLT